MAIWMDMTNTMRTWQGGCVGIIRAELEIAKNLKKLDPHIKFCVSENVGFSELDDIELQWLWDSDSVADAYLKHFNRIINQEQKQAPIPIGLKNAMDFSDARIDRIRYSRELLINHFSGIRKLALKYSTAIIYKPLQMYSRICASNKRTKVSGTLVEEKFKYPFKEGDIVFSCGWYTSNKEYQYSKVKSELRNILLIYMVYDLMLVKKDLKHLYGAASAFENYLSWIAINCDYIFYGGETAKKDANEFFIENKLPLHDGKAIKFGSNIAVFHNNLDKKTVLKKYNITEPYILSVGAIDIKKNYITIYKAYKIMINNIPLNEIPQLVIVGGKFGNNTASELIKYDCKLHNKIVLINPMDNELDAIYQNCKFTILPTVYEGWSLTLPESLSYGKFCLCSNVEPLKEIAGDLADYVDTLDPAAWAKKILYYYNKTDLRSYERKILSQWKNITWSDCGKQISYYLNEIEAKNRNIESKPTIFYDLTLMWHSICQTANVSGILRTQLLLAKYLSEEIKDIKYLVLLKDQYILLDKCSLSPLFQNITVESAFKEMVPQFYWLHEQKKSSLNKKTQHDDLKQSAWLLISVLPPKIQKQIITYIKNSQKRKKIKSNKLEFDYKLPMKNGDVFFSSGVGFDANIYHILQKEKCRIGFKFIQLIYDLTPVLVPQTHKEETRRFYNKFLRITNQLCDYIFYGGETAKSDSVLYAKDNELPVKPGIAIRFGSNIVNSKNHSKEHEKEILKKLGITQPYIMAVGSIELRKNHETLYQAYIDMMNQSKDLPQMIFCGYPGWKTEEFCSLLIRDERIKGKILMFTPNDEELDILYRNCEFTILASLYEGWSLTLPESLNYGKFCIASNVTPLKEIGKDFIDYVDPYDIKAWSERILYYYKNPQRLAERTQNIQENWHSITWGECAQEVAKNLLDLL